MVVLSVCLSVRVVFQKRGFEISSIDFSNMSKLILLDSLLQEVTTAELPMANSLMRPSLYCLIHFYKRLPQTYCKWPLV